MAQQVADDDTTGEQTGTNADNGEVSEKAYEVIYGTSHEDNSKALNGATEALIDDLIFEGVPFGVEVWRIDHYDRGIGFCIALWGGHPKENPKAEIFDPIVFAGSSR